MIRISHTQLEQVREDPITYREKNMARTYFPPPGRKRFLQWAIRCHYHAHGLAEAESYLHHNFDKRGFTAQSTDTFTEYLYNYHEDFLLVEKSILKILKLGDRIKLPLTDECLLTGEIDRVDFTPQGYTAWIFEVEDRLWMQELRSPLIQSYYAEEFGAPLNEITVGFYFFESRQYVQNCFTKREIDRAYAAACKIGDLLIN